MCPWYVDTAMARGIADTEAERRGESTDVVWKRMEASNPQGRMITADEVAELVAFLCTSGARPITGQALVVASGYFTF